MGDDQDGLGDRVEGLVEDGLGDPCLAAADKTGRDRREQDHPVRGEDTGETCCGVDRGDRAAAGADDVDGQWRAAADVGDDRAQIVGMILMRAESTKAVTGLIIRRRIDQRRREPCLANSSDIAGEGVAGEIAGAAAIVIQVEYAAATGQQHEGCDGVAARVGCSEAIGLGLAVADVHRDALAARFLCVHGKGYCRHDADEECESQLHISTIPRRHSAEKAKWEA